MKQKASLSLIGLFVVGASLLAAGVVLMYGAGEYFKKKESFVLYFNDSLKGLDVGAPVRFMGVKVGNVTGVELVFDKANLSFCTPVYIDVDTSRITLRDYGPGNDETVGALDEKAFRKNLIDRGLRAQLKINSLLTGMLYVDLGFHPDKPYALNNKIKGVEEIPTVISDMAQFSKAIEGIPVEALVDRMISAVESIDRLISSAEDKHTLENVNEAVLEFKGLMQQAGKAIGPIAGSIEGAAQETRTLAKNSDAGVKKTLDALERVVVSSEAVMGKAETILGSLDATFGKDSAITYRLGTMLGEVSESARAMRALADYLERHPEALVFGKGNGG